MKLLQRYFEENFFLIPIRKQDKRPLRRKWTEHSLSYMEAERTVKDGLNLAVVSGKQSIKEGYELVIIDIDNRPAVSDNQYGVTWVNYFRQFNTWISLTPNQGFHIYLRVKPHEDQSKVKAYLDKYDLHQHRSTLDPKHEDNTFLEELWSQTYPKDDQKFFADTIRWTSMYALLAPSKIRTNDYKLKSYWWLDDCKGEILKL